MAVSNVVNEVISVFEQDTSPGTTSGSATVSRMISVLAVIYEKARNAVEFRAEHLIRRAAIERIFKRRVILNGTAPSIANSLITELMWAKYIDSSFIDEQKEADLTYIIDKYLTVKKAISSGHGSVSWDTVLGIASTEIDETIVSGKKREALLYFFYQAIRSKISIAALGEQETNLITFIAAERAYMQSDEAVIEYHTVKLINSDWAKNSKTVTSAEVDTFLEQIKTIKTMLVHPSVAPVFRYLRRQIPPFLLLRDLFFETNAQTREYIDDPKKLDEKLTQIAERRYNETGKKVRRAMIRSFIYIFLTKMVFAFALEAPYDLYIAKKLLVVPLVVNTLFPPIMLFLVAGLFSVPGVDNTRRLIDRIKRIVYNFDDLKDEKDTFTAKERVRRPMLTAGFSVMYLITFAITFGLINYVLTLLQFSIVSKIIFVFFVALVSFFAYRIRQSAKEYEMIERQGFLEPIVDFFLLPVLQAGQFLSAEIAKINIFIFIFDFILEAPLKTIFELIEEWIRFIRLKKEEIV
jgi:hypothetical protein